jgi:hypothetical protein
MTSTPGDPLPDGDEDAPIDATQPEPATPLDDDDSLVAPIAQPVNRALASLVDEMREELGGPA